MSERGKLSENRTHFWHLSRSSW